MGENYRLVRIEQPSFLKRHQRWLSISGAIIVFFTFILREGYQSRLKDEIAEIDAAEASAKLHRDSTSIIFDITKVETNLNAEIDDQDRDPQSPVHKAALRADMDGLFTESQAISLIADNAIDLIHHSESFHEEEKDADQFKKSAQDFQSNLGRAEYNLQDLIFINSLEIEMKELLTRGMNFENELLKKMDTIRIRDKERLKVLDIFSYLLFGIGWLLAFTDRAFNIEEFGSEG